GEKPSTFEAGSFVVDGLWLVQNGRYCGLQAKRFHTGRVRHKPERKRRRKAQGRRARWGVRPKLDAVGQGSPACGESRQGQGFRISRKLASPAIGGRIATGPAHLEAGTEAKRYSSRPHGIAESFRARSRYGYRPLRARNGRFARQPEQRGLALANWKRRGVLSEGKPQAP